MWFPSVWYGIPRLLFGANMSTGAFFTMKCKNQLALVCPISNIGAIARPLVAFSGFYESHEPPPSGDARGIVLPHRNGHQNGQQSGCILHHHLVHCCPGRPPGRYCHRPWYTSGKHFPAKWRDSLKATIVAEASDDSPSSPDLTTTQWVILLIS